MQRIRGTCSGKGSEQKPLDRRGSAWAWRESWAAMKKQTPINLNTSLAVMLRSLTRLVSHAAASDVATAVSYPAAAAAVAVSD